MALTLSAGALQEGWVARCCECKRDTIVPGAVTRTGARRVLEASMQWAEHPQRGWLCRDCRSITKSKT